MSDHITSPSSSVADLSPWLLLPPSPHSLELLQTGCRALAEYAPLPFHTSEALWSPASQAPFRTLCLSPPHTHPDSPNSGPLYTVPSESDTSPHPSLLSFCLPDSTSPAQQLCCSLLLCPLHCKEKLKTRAVAFFMGCQCWREARGQMTHLAPWHQAQCLAEGLPVCTE